MKYTFNVCLTDDKYYQFNKFIAFKSVYGRKDMMKTRIFFSVLILACALFLGLLEGGTSGLWRAVLNLIFLILFQLLLNPIVCWVLRLEIKVMKKRGKMPFLSNSVIEFDEEKIYETTSEQKIEQNYSAIERISVIEGQGVYCHINKMMAFILPIDAFENEDKWQDFVAFIKTKVETVDEYPLKK